MTVWPPTMHIVQIAIGLSSTRIRMWAHYIEIIKAVIERNYGVLVR